MLLPRSASQSSLITIDWWCNFLLQTLLPQAPGSQDSKQAKCILLDQVKQAVYAAQPADASLLDLLYSVSLEQVYTSKHLFWNAAHLPSFPPADLACYSFCT